MRADGGADGTETMRETRVSTQPNGYLIQVKPGELDLYRFATHQRNALAGPSRRATILALLFAGLAFPVHGQRARPQPAGPYVWAKWYPYRSSWTNASSGVLTSLIYAEPPLGPA